MNLPTSSTGPIARVPLAPNCLQIFSAVGLFKRDESRRCKHTARMASPLIKRSSTIGRSPVTMGRFTPRFPLLLFSGTNTGSCERLIKGLVLEISSNASIHLRTLRGTSFATSFWRSSSDWSVSTTTSKPSGRMTSISLRSISISKCCCPGIGTLFGNRRTPNSEDRSTSTNDSNS